MSEKILRSSICVPSTVHGYSLSMEYIKSWFFKKFNKEYFKTVHIDQKHVLDDFRDFDMYANLKKLKPSVAITPKISFDFNREMIDMYNGGFDSYVKRHKANNSFLVDKEKNLYLDMVFEALEVEYNFRMRVSTRAQQLDLFKYLNGAFRIGGTQSDSVDMDFHIPYSLMLQLAQDTGFEVKDDKVVNIIDFVSYLNSKSEIPILYKLRTINGKNEFFLRLQEISTHISCLDPLSVDDGERENMIYSNYIIEFNVTLKTLVPKMYIYYSLNEHEHVQIMEHSSENMVGLYNIKLPDIPEVNSKGWDQYLITSYYEDTSGVVAEIDIRELFEGSQLEKVINHTKSLYLNPAVFVDFRLYVEGYYYEHEIDWNTYILKTVKPVINKRIEISIYVDLLYMKEQILVLDSEDHKKRIKK